MRFIKTLLLLAMCGVTFLSQGFSAVRDGNVEAELLSEVSSIQPGKPFCLAVRLSMDEGWHIYWKNPGDSGLATSVEWNLPDGLSAEALEWPRPEKIDTPPFATFGYEHEAALMVKMNVHPTFAGSAAKIQANVTWLSCKEICVPGQANLEVELPVSNETQNVNQENASEFQKFRKEFPLPLDWQFSAEQKNKNMVLQFIPVGVNLEAKDAYFFPEEQGILEYAEKQNLSSKAGRYQLQSPLSPRFKKKLSRLKGVLVFSDTSVPAVSVDVSVRKTFFNLGG